MGLPRIAPYDVPGAENYPHNRVDWAVDPARAVLLVHDMQQYFVDAFARDDTSRSPVDSAIVNINRLREVATQAGIPVIFTTQPPNQLAADRGLLSDFWGPGLQSEASARVVAELEPHGSDRVLTKWRYNAFIRTPLAEIMSEQGRDQLLIVGVYAHIGCLLTACDAFMRDIQPFLIGDAVADFSRDEHLRALEYAAQRCAVVQTTDAALSSIATARNLALAGER